MNTCMYVCNVHPLYDHLGVLVMSEVMPSGVSVKSFQHELNMYHINVDIQYVSILFIVL